MAIVNDTLDNVGVAFYTSTGNTAMVVAYICNTDATEVTIQLHAVPSGGSVVLENTLYKDLVIPAGDTYIIDTEKLVFADGDAIIGIASTNSVVVTTVSYVGI